MMYGKKKPMAKKTGKKPSKTTNKKPMSKKGKGYK